MKATLVYFIKQNYRNGVVEIVIWALPEHTPDRPHGFKYRMVYVVEGKRKVGYDNEAGKGDHKHFGNRELPYDFVDIPTLFADFWNDVEEVAG